MRHFPRVTVPARRAVTASLAVALLAATTACGGGGSDRATGAPAASDLAAGQQDGAVTVKTFAFDPDPIRVEAGTTVSWTNKDEILHTVTSGAREDADSAFDEELDGPGSVPEHTFETPGTYAYHCTVHPGMDGVVEVS